MHLGLPTGLLCSHFLTKIMYVLHIPLICVICLAHLILLDQDMSHKEGWWEEINSNWNILHEIDGKLCTPSLPIKELTYLHIFPVADHV
jgi:hypothetical protein